MLDPVLLQILSGGCPDPKLHPGGRAPRLAPVDRQPAHPQAGAGGRAPAVRPRHPFGRNDRGRRSHDRVRPQHPGGERTGEALFRRLANCVAGCGSARRRISWPRVLPEVLLEFVRTHPLVEFELTVGMSGELNEKLARGELDLVCGKRRPGEERGRLVWRDRLAWVIRRAAPTRFIAAGAADSVFAAQHHPRDRAGGAGASGRAWRIVCTSGSLSGLRAAALAGLGVTVVPQGPDPGGP